jgi:probable phosphoglycerate mutase
VTTLLLVRHGLTELTGSTLSGWTPELHLDGRGREQARALGARLAPIPLAAAVTSPLERCRETAEAVLADPGRADTPEKLEVDERFGEVHYGDWTGRPLTELAKEKLWPVVQAHASAARFPGEFAGREGESLAESQHRAVQAVRDWNARLGPDATYLVCSHGDIIKAITADALGLHLDQFQRIQVEPASLTVIRYTELRPFVVRMNDTGGSVESLLPKPEDSQASGRGEGDAMVGGDA